MSSNSEVFSNSVDGQVSSGQLGPVFIFVFFIFLFYGSWRPVVWYITAIFAGPYTGPIIYTVGDCRDERKKGFKRTTDESPERPRKRRKMGQSPSQHCSQTSAPIRPSAVFRAKYAEEVQLGEGGYGCVFAGYRRHDNLPAAIKHIRKGITRHLPTCVDKNNKTVPLEVALMLRLKPASGGTSAAVTLLDWYIRDKLIHILKRPIIIKQLVDAVREIHSKGVFHRDIKPDNILCETGPGGPRIRIIDLHGTFLSEGMYTTPQGTSLYTSPEWFLDCCYRAEPATNAEICLNKNPAARPSLETLNLHPWLIQRL